MGQGQVPQSCPGDGIAPPKGESRGWAQEEGAWHSELQVDVGCPHQHPLCDVKTSEPGEPPPHCWSCSQRKIKEIPKEGLSALPEQAAGRCQPHLG